MKAEARSASSFPPSEPAKPASGERSAKGQPFPAELAEAISNERSAEGLLAKLATFKEQLGCGTVSLALFNGSAARLFSPGEGGKVLESEGALSGSSLSAVAASGEAYVENRIGKYSDFFDERQLAEQGYRHYMCVPIRFNGKVAGAISFASREESFGQQRLQQARLISTLAALALNSASATEKAASSEAVSRALFENAAEVILLADADSGRLIAANSGAEIATGYGQDELLRLSLSNLFGEKEAGQISSGGGEAAFRLKRKNGEERLLQAKHAAVEDNGRWLLVVTGADVTEKVASESNYRDVVESISDIVFSLNGYGEIAAINDEVENVLGRRRDSLTGAPFGSIVYDQDYKRLSSVLQDIRAGSRTIRGLELRLLTSTGEPRWFEMNGRGYYDAAGELLKITGVLRDVDERKESFESDQLSANLFANSSDAFIAIDTMGLVKVWNRSAESMLGFKRDEVRGRDVRIIYPDDRRGELDALVKKLNDSGSVLDFPTARMRKDGQQVFVRISAFAIKDEEGRVIGYAEMLKDMTEQHNAEEAERARKKLEERNRYLQELNEMKSVFVSNVSHELRTPLTNIHGYSSLLLDGTAGRLADEQKEFVEIIHSETDRLTRLINDLLDLSRMERGKFRLSPRLFDLRDLAEKCSCQAMADAKGLPVQWNFEPGLPQIYGDPARISQVLINLISNAVKFTDRGGITVTVARKGRNFVQVDVADTGHGISEEDQRSLFKRFYQVPRPDGQKREGTGLGLAITKEIVKLHGGKIWVESKLGEGSRFSFTIRTVPKRQRGAAEEQAQPAAQPDGAQDGAQPTGARQQPVAQGESSPAGTQQQPGAQGESSPAGAMQQVPSEEQPGEDNTPDSQTPDVVR